MKMSDKEKKDVGRPTAEKTAQRNWHEIPNKMKAKVPTLVEKAMARIESILNDEKASDSSVLRAADTTLKLYKEMKDAENATLEDDKKEEDNAEGLLAAVVAERKPMISLVAFNPEEKKVM
jgi:hypothetical protein